MTDQKMRPPPGDLRYACEKFSSAAYDIENARQRGQRADPQARERYTDELLREALGRARGEISPVSGNDVPHALWPRIDALKARLTPGIGPKGQTHYAKLPAQEVIALADEFIDVARRLKESLSGANAN
ncbi:MAG: hypothetical protein ABSC94_30145 [Polyangiaceae bacterium]|jgi:hypothetical protein